MSFFIFINVMLFVLSIGSSIFLCYRSANFEISKPLIFATPISIFVISVISILISYNSHRFNEIRNYKIVSLKHQEQYTKKVTYTVQVANGTDKKGNVKYRTEVRTRTDRIGPFWEKTSSSGVISDISKSEYERWKNLWKNEEHVGTIKGTSASFFGSIDGKTFKIKWPGTAETLFPAPEIHRYTNKLRNSNSILGFKTSGGHPVDKGKTSGLISSVNLGSDAEEKLNRLNSVLGERKQIHIIIHASDHKVDDSIEIVKSWGGINKNELAIFIGVRGGKIVWSSVKSWMKNSEVADSIRDELMMNESANIDKICPVIEKHLGKWKRREFADFDYLPMTVATSSIVIFIIELLALVCSFILGGNATKKSRKITSYRFR